MLADMPQFVEQKVCLSCDGCCRFKDDKSVWRPKVFPEEVEGLNEKKVSGSSAAGPKNVTGDFYLRTVPGKDGCHCAFFDMKGNSCRIYRDRPFECRIYPVILHRGRGDDQISVCVHLSCPYVLEHREKESFDIYLGKLKTYFSDQKIASFLNEHISSVQDYASFKNELEILFKIPNESLP